MLSLTRSQLQAKYSIHVTWSPVLFLKCLVSSFWVQRNIRKFIINYVPKIYRNKESFSWCVPFWRQVKNGESQANNSRENNLIIVLAIKVFRNKLATIVFIFGTCLMDLYILTVRCSNFGDVKLLFIFWQSHWCLHFPSLSPPPPNQI